jgi:predicted AlkP superfamily pyrophosphatase or phosphodiesterase
MTQVSPETTRQPYQWTTALPSAQQTLLQSSLNAIESCKFGPGFIRPAYDNFCFSNFPGLFEQLLTGETQRRSFPNEVSRSLGSFDHVIFAFIDAFGWESFQRFRDDSSLFRAIEQDGLVLKGTSQFPSTTAAHVTTILSGLPAYEHEVCGWDYYEPKVGRMIKPLRFSFSEDETSGTLESCGFTPNQVLPKGNFLSNLAADSVSVRLHGPAAFYPSAFCLRYGSQNAIRGYSSIEESIASMIEAISEKPPRSYQCLYVDAYDTICHQHGVGSKSSDKVAKEILRSLGRLLNRSMPGKTLLVVSSDHGHIADRPHGKIAINKLIPGIETMLKVDSRGEPIRFSGGKRYLFLHPRDETRELLEQELRSKLDGAATVMSLPELHAAGLLGPGPLKDSFAERLGSIGILPHPGYSVAWIEPPVFDNSALSGHGGVSPQEMEIPILFLPLR